MQIDRELTYEFIEKNNITTLVIIEEPKIPEGSFSSSVIARVQCNDKEKTIALWTMSKKSKNAVIDKFGTDTLKMTGQKIPILVNQYQRGRYTINVNTEELMKKQTMIV